MKAIIVSILFLASFTAHSQFIATVVLEETFDEMCGETLYALFSGFDGQEKAECDLSEEELVALMNEKIQYLKEHPKTKLKTVLGVYINCEGDKFDSHTGLEKSHPELAKEINAILMENGIWTPGTYNGDKVDCSELMSIRIKKGVIYLD